MNKFSLRWLIYAEEDLKTAQILLRERLYNQICFHSQQCIEKSLKAFLRAKRQKIPRIHELVELLNMCQELDSSYEIFLESCKIVGKYYIPTRYPEALPGSLAEGGLPEREDAEKALEIAKEILWFVKDKIETKESCPEDRR